MRRNFFPASAVLSKHDALTAAGKLRALLTRNGVPVRMLYLFGSAARGTTHRWSDIDVAIVCDPFGENPLEEYCEIARHAFAIDPRISVLYFRPEHFANPASGVVRELRREGIAVA